MSEQKQLENYAMLAKRISVMNSNEAIVSPQNETDMKVILSLGIQKMVPLAEELINTYPSNESICVGYDLLKSSLQGEEINLGKIIEIYQQSGLQFENPSVGLVIAWLFVYGNYDFSESPQGMIGRHLFDGKVGPYFPLMPMMQALVKEPLYKENEVYSLTALLLFTDYEEFRMLSRNTNI